MDNITHTLVGLIAGEAAARGLPAGTSALPDSTRRTALLCLGMIGGNLPDVDLLWSMSSFTSDKAGYLLEHRGYTHTIAGCAALAALLYLSTLLCLRWRSHTTSSGDRWTLGAMAALSVALHLGMDALNSYGVHPFWPWNNRWYYGDSVFIVEPLYWLAAAPLLFGLRTVIARILLALALAVASVAVWGVHRFDLLWLGAPLLALLLVFLGRRARLRTAALASASLAGVVFICFVAAGHVAERHMEALARNQFPRYQTLDQVMTPTPTNPLCWDVLLIQSLGNEFVVRHGFLSIASPPTASACVAVLAGKGTAPMTRVESTDSAAIRWLGEFTMSRLQLASLVAADCAARELMQFVRVPFAVQSDHAWVLGDLRFDRESGAGMAEIEIDPGHASACRYHAPWTPPRADLLTNPG